MAEARGVLRPGGVFAIWWNQTVCDADCEHAQAARFPPVAPAWHQFSATEITHDCGQITERFHTILLAAAVQDEPPGA